MNQSPPTAPGPLLSTRSPRMRMVMLGSLIHAVLMVATCFVTPLAMDSNIWPIAGMFWSVLTVPVAAVMGALTGWVTQRLQRTVAVSIVVVAGAMLAGVAGMIIANNR